MNSAVQRRSLPAVHGLREERFAARQIASGVKDDEQASW
jgi:hypothetical protein